LTWLLIAVATGGAWVFYFADAPTLARQLVTFEAPLVAYVCVGIFTATTYVLGGIAREQVCTYMCPWPRIQGAMLDEDSLVVTYQGWRGEPRGKHKTGTGWEGRGHCIDCQACVAVCPMGIDIRDGLQLECIGCGLCIDACDRVMERVGLPTKLIRFDTERNREAKAAGKTARWHPIRPRTIAYAGFLLLAGLALLGSLLLRSDLEINVLPDRAPLFVRLSDGRIQNAYTIKILNMQRAERRFTLAVEGADGVRVNIVGAAADGSLEARPDQVATYRVLVNLPPAALAGDTTAIAFLLTDLATGTAARHETVFKGPGS
jgi:cytochrome c oxidase accessory protein FixG